MSRAVGEAVPSATVEQGSMTTSSGMPIRWAVSATFLVPTVIDTGT